MKKSIILTLLIASSIMLLSNCSEEKKWVKAPINPNGDSELALVMRAMYEHSDSIATLIKSGKAPQAIHLFENIHTATATQPEKVSTSLYKAMADNYLESVKELKNSGQDEYIKYFNALVDNCMNCHQAVCPGPMVKIKKLYIGDK